MYKKLWVATKERFYNKRDCKHVCPFVDRSTSKFIGLCGYTEIVGGGGGGDSGWKQRGFAFVFCTKKSSQVFNMLQLFLVNNRKWSRFPRELHVFFTPERKFWKRNLFFVQTVQLAQFFLHKNYFWIVSFLHTFICSTSEKIALKFFKSLHFINFSLQNSQKTSLCLLTDDGNDAISVYFFQEKIDRERKNEKYV